MRLASKLLTSLATTVLLVLGVAGLLDERRRDDLMRLDLETQTRGARAVRELTTALCENAGPAAARAMFQAADPKLPRDWKWLGLDQIPAVPERDLRSELAAQMASGNAVMHDWVDQNGNPMRSVYVPIAPHGRPEAVVSITDSLAPRQAFHRRSQMQTASIGLVVMALAGTLALILGQRFVRRPLAAIADGIRAFGDGRFDAMPAITAHDELGDLAKEVAALGTRLAARERLRHEDRLRTVGQLAAGVAHELGTPLSVVGIRARMIAAREVEGQGAVDNATIILDQTDRMSGLVRQLLDYSRRQSGPAADVELHDVARKVIEVLEPMARKRGVAVRLASPAGRFVVHAELAQMQQVFLNVVLNAIQALPEGGTVSVSMGRDRLTPPGSRGPTAEYLWVRVEDDGRGIAPEHLPHIFEPFYTTKTVGEGTGLGLPVALAIVEDHGGWIDATNGTRGGARFTVVLPPASTISTERLAS